MDNEATIINRQTRELAALKTVGNASAGVIANSPITASWSGTVSSTVPSGKTYNAQWTVRFTADTSPDFVPFAQCGFNYSISPTFASVNGMTMADPSAFDEMQFCQVNGDYGNGFIEWHILFSNFIGTTATITLNISVYSANTGTISLVKDF